MKAAANSRKTAAPKAANPTPAQSGSELGEVKMALRGEQGREYLIQ